MCYWVLMTKPIISKGYKSFDLMWMARIAPRVWVFAINTIFASFSFILGFLGFELLLLGFGAELGGGLGYHLSLSSLRLLIKTSLFVLMHPKLCF